MPENERYQTRLEGEQIDDALEQMKLRIPEGWAVGTRDGEDVPSTSQFYHNNAKYYAQLAYTYAHQGEIFIARYGQATSTQINQAVNSRKVPVIAITQNTGSASSRYTPYLYIGTVSISGTQNFLFASLSPDDAHGVALQPTARYVACTTSGNTWSTPDPIVLAKYDFVATELQLKAPLASPHFTGIPTVPNIDESNQYGDQIANVTWVANRISEVTDRLTNINKYAAELYDHTKAYRVGEYVIQGDKLYKCIYDMPSPDSSFFYWHWEQVTLTDEIVKTSEELLSAFVTETITNADIASFSDGASNIPVKSFVGSIIPVQDLHGYEYPWPAGGGKNKYNDATTTAGEWIAADGTIGSSSAFALSDYIPISGASVTISGNTGGWGSSPAVCFFDEGKNYISGTHPTTNPVTLTIPSGAAYLRTSLSATSRSTLQVELGSTATSYAPYSNVCPISGWAGAEITRTGKNLYDPSKAGNITIPSGVVRNGEIIRISAGDWTVSRASSGTVLYYAWNDGTAHESSMTSVLESHFTAAADCDLYLLVGSGASISSVTNLQVEKGSSASTYEAYQGDTILLTFGETVYAGTITALGGGQWKIQPTTGIVDLGTRTWAYNSTYGFFENEFSSLANGSVADGYLWCESYQPVDGVANAQMPSKPDMSICHVNKYIKVKDSRYTDGTAFKSAVNGVMLCYPLATLPDPIIVSASDLETILGSNTVWLNCGSVTELEYRADTKLYIAKLLGNGTRTLSLNRPTVLADTPTELVDVSSESTEEVEGGEEQVEPEVEESKVTDYTEE